MKSSGRRGAWVGVGGTSIAAPKIAAIVADVNTACTARVGDLAPKLVALAAGNGYGTALGDVTVGDNDLTRTHANRFTAADRLRSRDRGRRADRRGLVVPAGHRR